MNSICVEFVSKRDLFMMPSHAILHITTKDASFKKMYFDNFSYVLDEFADQLENWTEMSDELEIRLVKDTIRWCKNNSL